MSGFPLLKRETNKMLLAGSVRFKLFEINVQEEENEATHCVLIMIVWDIECYSRNFRVYLWINSAWYQGFSPVHDLRHNLIRIKGTCILEISLYLFAWRSSCLKQTLGTVTLLYIRFKFCLHDVLLVICLVRLHSRHSQNETDYHYLQYFVLCCPM